jgi:3-oxoacyl-[acyl-carrier protein] reductase
MSGTLQGRVAIVTGAGRNIGAAVATRLAADGAAVVVNYPDEQSEAAAAQVVAHIAGAGGRALAMRADVSNEAEVQALVAETISAFGHPDILINNAAISVAAQAPWSALSAEAWDRVLRVNVTGAFLCARALYGSMRARGRGHIVNMSSVTALLGRTGNLHYVTSKAALIGFTRALAREVGNENIRVNALILGAIRTPDEAIYGNQEEVDALVLPLQSLKRRGMPADVGGVVSFLVSADADFITGQCLTVDGGWVMH